MFSRKRQAAVCNSTRDLKQEVEDKDNTIAQLQAQVSELRDEISKHKADAADFFKTLDEWKKQWYSAVEVRDEEIRSLGSQLLECQTTEDRLKQDLENEVRSVETWKCASRAQELINSSMRMRNSSTHVSEKADISTQTPSDVETCDLGIQTESNVCVTRNSQTDNSWKPAPAPRKQKISTSVQCDLPRENKSGLSSFNSIVNDPSQTGVKVKTRARNAASTIATGSGSSDYTRHSTSVRSSDSDSDAGYYRPPHLRREKKEKKSTFSQSRRGEYNFAKHAYRQDHSRNSYKSTQRRSSDHYRYKKHSSHHRYNDTDCYNYSDSSYYRGAEHFEDMYWYVGNALSEMLYYFMPVF